MDAAGPGQLDGDGASEARPAAGHDGRRAVEGAGGQEGGSRRRRFGQSHGGGLPYFPSKSACCFLAFAAYPAGMSSLTNSTDALSASNLSASDRPR